MASPTITKEMREKIVQNMSKYIFGKEEAALVKRTSKLAIAAYNEKYDAKTRKAMEALGKDYIQRDYDIDLNINGMAVRL